MNNRMAAGGAFPSEQTVLRNPYLPLVRNLLHSLPIEVSACVLLASARMDSLSPQEFAVISRIFFEHKTIARELGLSHRTVNHYIQNAYTKLGLKDLHIEGRVYRRAIISALALLVVSMRLESTLGETLLAPDDEIARFFPGLSSDATL